MMSDPISPVDAEAAFLDSRLSVTHVPFRIAGEYGVLHKGKDKLVLGPAAATLVKALGQGSTLRQIITSLQPSNHDDAQRFSRGAAAFYTQLFTLGFLHGATHISPSNLALSVAPGTITRNESSCATSRNMTAEENSSLSAKLDDLYWANHYIYKMYLELTYRCNFRCSHCYNPSHINTGELNTHEWVRVMDELAAAGCYVLALTGGEPFARKDIIDLLLAAKDRGFSIRINTNASLIKRDHILALKELGHYLQELYISFYGGSPETSQAVTGNKDGFKASISATQALHEAGVPVFAKFISLKDNIHEGALFEKTLSSLSIPHAVLTETINPRTDRSVASLVQLVPASSFTAVVDSRKIVPRANPTESACRPGHIRGAVTPNGDVSPCEWLTDFKLGNLREDSLSSIWYGSGFLKFRQAFKEEQEECPSCYLNPSCGRCPAHSYLETGSLFKCAPNHRRDAEIIYQRAN